jgi:hypothetical protein
MTAAMLVLEPIFEADLPPEQYAYRPSRHRSSWPSPERLLGFPCKGRHRLRKALGRHLPGIDTATFEKTATEAKENCPVSKALKAVEITLTARLV